jgi:uncharacterized membrane protein
MNYTLVTGPYMIGLLFIIIGLLQKFLPPKNINSWFGYRSPAARVSPQTWAEANRFSSAFMIRAGVFVLIAGFIIYMAAIYFKADAGILKTVGYIILFGGAIGIGAVTSMVTEKHLAKTFKAKPAKKRK